MRRRGLPRGSRRGSAPSRRLRARLLAAKSCPFGGGGPGWPGSLRPWRRWPFSLRLRSRSSTGPRRAVNPRMLRPLQRGAWRPSRWCCCPKPLGRRPWRGSLANPPVREFQPPGPVRASWRGRAKRREGWDWPGRIRPSGLYSCSTQRAFPRGRRPAHLLLIQAGSQRASGRKPPSAWW